MQQNSASDEASSPAPQQRRAPAQRSESTASASTTGADGRAYTPDQVKVVQDVLKAKQGGRGAHYRVLGLQQEASATEIKKAYRKLSLKVHPDKNSAPHADEAFKAVGLAYATLSDDQKRAVYDRYGDEDPDNRGGGMRPGGMRHGGGPEMTPEEIFAAFFGGGMPGMHAGGPGFHVYSTGFGPGMGFQQRRRPRQAAQGQQRDETPGLGALMQFAPILLMLLFSFFNMRDSDTASHRGPMPGEGKYFSLTVRTNCGRRRKRRFHAHHSVAEPASIPQSAPHAAVQSEGHSLLCLRQVPADVLSRSISVGTGRADG